jgi:hypothetical protein
MATRNREWHPERTWVFVVGTLEWKHPDWLSPFPEKYRRDASLVEFFKQEGVPQTQIIYLQDQQATLGQIERSLGKLSQARPNDFLFLYYCGHGYKDDDGHAFFASYDAGDEGVYGWAVNSIPPAIERHFPGAHALFAVDCCCSGSLAHAIKRQTDRISYACLSSSLANESSTGNWTFTEALLSALQGHAFADDDNSEHITLSELAQQIENDMAFAEDQKSTFATTGTFSPGFVLARARKKVAPRVGERVEVLSGGNWYKARIIDADGDQFKVHYYGWDAVDDEWVKASQMRPPTVNQYKVGENVEVSWKSKWYPATIKQVHDNVHLIHYHDYSDDWDEWVSARRIRRPDEES